MQLSLTPALRVTSALSSSELMMRVQRRFPSFTCSVRVLRPASALTRSMFLFTVQVICVGEYYKTGKRSDNCIQGRERKDQRTLTSGPWLTSLRDTPPYSGSICTTAALSSSMRSVVTNAVRVSSGGVGKTSPPYISLKVSSH